MSEVSIAQRPAPAPARGGSGRLDWIDRLRVALTLLVIAHHSAATYASIPVWYVVLGGKDPSSDLLSGFLVLNQLWFMGAFFLLSGVFTPASADRKGTGRFVRDRLVRLGIPLLAYVVVIRPLAMVPAGISEMRDHRAHGKPFSLAWYLLVSGDPGVTWFLEVLIVFCLGYAVLRLVRRPRTEVRASRPPLWGLGLVTVGLAVAMFFWVMWVPLGTYWPVVGLPSPTFLPQYVAMFALGIVAARRAWLTTMPGWWAAPAAGAVVVGGAGFAATIAGSGPVTGVVSALGSALFAVGATVLAVLLFRTRAHRVAGRFGRFVAQQAFTVYVVHPIVLVAVAVALIGVGGPAVLRALLLFAVAVPLCWLVAWALRRIPAVRRIM
ncbi:MAG TPA: acyltransferase [Actinocatenispora sp.]